jgi:hypothetical protein
MEAKMIAETTLQQLGGAGRLTAMIGAKHFGYDKNGTLTFQFKMCKKANGVRIELNGKDLYDVTFTKFNARTYEVKEVHKFEDVYADQLKEVFESFTGLYLSL